MAVAYFLNIISTPTWRGW